MAARRSLRGKRGKIKEAWDTNPKSENNPNPKNKEKRPLCEKKRPLCEEARTIMSKHGIISTSFDFGKVDDETQIEAAKALVGLNGDIIFNQNDVPIKPKSLVAIWRESQKKDKPPDKTS